MSWSYRKSINAGPFRLNFSKSGISYSVGVKGARIQMNSKGTYVNLSANGITYRRKISGTPALPHAAEPQVLEHTITSAAIEQLTDADSREFVTELSQKCQKLSYARWIGLPLLVTFLAIL